MKKYSWSFNEHEDCYSDSCDTVTECISEAMSEWAGENDVVHTSVYIGENKEIIPTIDVGRALDNTIDNLYENYSWLDDVSLYDCKKEEEIEELQNNIDIVFHTWLKKYRYYPRFYSVENIKEYPLNEG